MDGPGTITWDEFLENAERFVQMSNELSDGWELRGNKNMPGEAYVARQRKQYVSSSSNLNNYSTPENNDSMDNFEFTLKHDPFEATSPIEKPLVTEHHVLWSMSYSVPVLYFNGWKSDFPGINPISVEEAQFFARSVELEYKELSQAIHPILGTPFLYLHPCMSHELIQITSNSCGTVPRLSSHVIHENVVRPAGLTCLHIHYFVIFEINESVEVRTYPRLFSRTRFLAGEIGARTYCAYEVSCFDCSNRQRTSTKLFQVARNDSQEYSSLKSCTVEDQTSAIVYRYRDHRGLVGGRGALVEVGRKGSVCIIGGR